MDIVLLRPVYLALLPIGLFLIWTFCKRYRGQSNWQRLGDPHLIQHLLSHQTNTGQSKWPYFGLAIGWCIACLAISGPAWEKQPSQMTDSLQGRMIVFDLSKSMNSTDIKPSRLTAAKYKLIDLIRAGAGKQQGLIVFSGDAFVVTPLTDDIETIINLLPELNTSTLPSQGSRSDLGLKLAISTFQSIGFASGEIILITDGATVNSINIANDASTNNFIVSVLAVGTENAEPIPLTNGGYLKDGSDNIVIPNIDYTTLKRVAQNGGGKFTKLTIGSSDIERINENPSARFIYTESDENNNRQHLTDRWVDGGPWFLLPLLLLAALSFRKGWILVLLISTTTLHTQPAVAFSWKDLWLRPDQQAQHYFTTEQYEKIPESAPSNWQGAGQYRLNQFDQAIQQFQNSEPKTVHSEFNRGNALAKSSQFEAALDAYQNAIDLDPSFDAAQSNYDLIKSLLDQQKQSQQNQSDAQNNPSDSQDQQQSETQQREQSTNNQVSNSEQEPQQSALEDQQSSPNSSNNPSDSKSSESQDNQPSESNESESATASGTETAQQADNSSTILDEEQQVLEQWLNRVPDEPGGLLKRKFAQQYSTREKQQNEQTW